MIEIPASSTAYVTSGLDLYIDSRWEAFVSPVMEYTLKDTESLGCGLNVILLSNTMVPASIYIFRNVVLKFRIDEQ